MKIENESVPNVEHTLTQRDVQVHECLIRVKIKTFEENVFVSFTFSHQKLKQILKLARSFKCDFEKILISKPLKQETTPNCHYIG